MTQPLRGRWCVIGIVAVMAACGGGGSSSTPTAPSATTATPTTTAPTAAEFSISVSVGGRPAGASPSVTAQATGRAGITIDIVERRGLQGEIRRMVATIRKGANTVLTDTLDEAALRSLVPGGSLTIPGGGRLSIPYSPRFPFTREDQLVIDVQGEFRDANGNVTSPTSSAVPVPADSIATCFASPNHLCLNNQRFQVDVFASGVRVTTMRRDSDTEGRYVFEDLVLIAKVLNACGLTNWYRAEVSVSGGRLPFTVFISDTLLGQTKTYVTGSSATPIVDTSAFATCP